MRTISRIFLGFVVVGAMTGLAIAQGRPHFRNHTAEKSQPVSVGKAAQAISGGSVAITQRAGVTKIRANGLPEHSVGAFPNAGNPHGIKAQSYVFSIKSSKLTNQPTELGLRRLFGVAVNGIPFDPGAAEFWRGNPQLGWQYDALGGAVTLGLDENFAHVQPNGAYHYHGIPTGLLADLGWRGDKASPLVGYAAGGFPIYALTADIDGVITRLESSYQLKAGSRPGGQAPSGAHDGAFIQDYQYVAGSGHLDMCNGAHVITEEFPNGTYAYFLTDSFPVIPRCLRGTADASFAKRR